jgi:hypothetical protein
MSSVKIQGNASGSGQFTVASPNSNNTRTATLPDADGNVVLDSATQTLTNKTIQGGAITSMTAQASTSGTSIDFTSIPSWVKRITVAFDGFSTNGTSLPLIRLGDAGGAETTGYNASAGVISTAGTGSSTASTAGFILATGVSAATTICGQGIFTLMNASTNTWSFTFTCTFSNSGATGFAGGTKALSDTLTQVRITTVNGTDTFDAGTINVLYEG